MEFNSAFKRLGDSNSGRNNKFPLPSSDVLQPPKHQNLAKDRRPAVPKILPIKMIKKQEPPLNIFAQDTVTPRPSVSAS